MTGLLNPTSSKKSFFFYFGTFFVGYLGHGTVHRVTLLFSPQISF